MLQDENQQSLSQLQSRYSTPEMKKDINLETPIPSPDEEEESGTLGSILDRRRSEVGALYDRALENLRSRYRGPDKSEMLLALGAQLMRPTENGTFMESLAGVPEVLLKYRQGQREASNEIEDLALKYELAKAAELTDLDIAKAKAKNNLQWIRAVDPDTGAITIVPVPRDGSAVGQQGGEQKTGALPLVQSDEDYDALPPGAEFLDPKGNRRRKPGGATPSASAPFPGEGSGG